MADDEIELNKGSDKRFSIEWEEVDEAGHIGPMNLTGAAVSIFDAHTALDGNLIATLDPDPTTGLIHFRLNWSASMPKGRVMSFRAKVTFPDDDNFDETSPPIWVLVK
jgi:hypothetical protein